MAWVESPQFQNHALRKRCSGRVGCLARKAVVSIGVQMRLWVDAFLVAACRRQLHLVISLSWFPNWARTCGFPGQLAGLHGLCSPTQCSLRSRASEVLWCALLRRSLLYRAYSARGLEWLGLIRAEGLDLNAGHAVLIIRTAIAKRTRCILVGNRIADTDNLRVRGNKGGAYGFLGILFRGAV